MDILKKKNKKHLTVKYRQGDERAYPIKKHIYANQVGRCSTELQAKT